MPIDTNFFFEANRIVYWNLLKGKTFDNGPKFSAAYRSGPICLTKLKPLQIDIFIMGFQLAPVQDSHNR